MSFCQSMDEGKLPETKYVAGSNYLDIGIVVDERLGRVVVLSALDNLERSIKPGSTGFKYYVWAA